MVGRGACWFAGLEYEVPGEYRWAGDGGADGEGGAAGRARRRRRRRRGGGAGEEGRSRRKLSSGAGPMPSDMTLRQRFIQRAQALPAGPADVGPKGPGRGRPRQA